MERGVGKHKLKQKSVLVDLIITVLVLLLATGIAYVFHRCKINEGNIVTVYILGVLIIAIVTSGRGYGLVSSLVSVLLFNYLYTKPYYSLSVFDKNYLITFLIMIIATLLATSLTARIKRQANEAEETAYRTKILFDTNRLLSQETSRVGIITVTRGQLMKLLNRKIIFFDDEEKMEEQKALTIEECEYLPIKIGEEVFGIVGIVLSGEPLEEFESSIANSIVGECALALQNNQAQKRREEADLKAKNQLLRVNLLRSISHDFRTPLTAISGNADILLSSEETLDVERRKKLYANIEEDALWLIDLVENLLSITRFEYNSIDLNLNVELLDEIMNEALQHIDRKGSERNIHVMLSDEMIFVKVEAKLIMQVVINLVNNAIKHTPVDSDIYVETKREGAEAVIIVADDGAGISDIAKDQIFDMFYSANKRVGDSRRSMGLGLALCKSIVTAHGGSIIVRDREPHGAEFEFRLPTEEMTNYEQTIDIGGRR